ncbi:hypothetical protein GOB93_06515 [Acetobacter musti]|uniref:Uncharacterized protein n=1 Tax=Acetobacter musti TaxID=864732 RepID=A0ABX0JLV7_9PROT|nr:hypothetical protein [Acetobacter musti]NHN84299.1 hypothetical protein [Acetobacter musti]
MATLLSEKNGEEDAWRGEPLLLRPSDRTPPGAEGSLVRPALSGVAVRPGLSGASGGWMLRAVTGR